MALAEQKFNIFTPDDLELIQKMLARIPKQSHDLAGVYTNGFTQKDPVYLGIKKIVIDRINQHFSNPIKNLTVGMQLITQDPFGPHSDYGNKGDSGGGHAYLIPLYMKYTDLAVKKLPSYTIIFDQVWQDPSSIENYLATNPNAPMPIPNAEHIWEDHMAKWPRKWAKYLSVKTMGEWQLGSAIYWNRDLIHASDDFTAKHIKEKSALVLFCQ